MTGAGTAELAFAKESSFMGSLQTGGDSTVDYWGFGRNPTIEDLSLQNQLLRLREAGAVESVESVKQNFEGAFSVSAIVSSDVQGDVEDLVFNDAGTSFKPGRPQSATVYAGLDYLDGTTERELEGCIPTDYELTYEQGGMVRLSLTMLYGDEIKNTSITPGTITKASDSSSAAFHGFDLSISGASVSKLQSATLSISEIARFQRDADTAPADAVMGPCNATLDATAIYSGPTRLERALGGTSNTTTDETLDGTTATVTINVGGTAVSTYDLPSIKTDQYTWQNLIAENEDTTEQVTWHVNDGVSIS